MLAVASRSSGFSMFAPVFLRQRVALRACGVRECTRVCVRV